MKKKELVAYIAKKSGHSQKDSEIMLDCIFEAIAELVAAGEEVQVNGFGAFGAKDRAARRSIDIMAIRNEQKKAMIDVPAAKKVYFKVGSTLKRRVDDAFKGIEE
ncbi:MAG: HU family DNA-binding protein [Clostridia bacterium]|nr:HU family DNA-binding protein [Clostridia bacterium]